MAKTHLDELRQFIADDRLHDEDIRAALEAQGIDTSGLDTGDESGTQDAGASEQPDVTETDAESPDALLATLEDESNTLVQTDQERRKRDKLKEENSFEAAQQRAADELQHTLGSIQKVRQDTTGGVRTRVNAVADRLGSMATPGGIGVPLVILLALLVFLIPVMTKGGESEPRFIWSWLVLTRKAKLLPESEAGGSSLKQQKTTASSNGSNTVTSEEAAAVLALPPLSTSSFTRYFPG